MSTLEFNRSHEGGASLLCVGLVLGPAVLVLASLTDLYVATRVFGSGDPLVGALSFFIFGAATGVPLQLALARSPVATHLQIASRSVLAERHYDKRGAALAGILSAIVTATGLYALREADPAVVLPLANMAPAVFAVVEGMQGRLRLKHAIAPVCLLLAGFWIIRQSELADLAGVTSAVVVAIIVRNLANIGSELAERSGASGNIPAFTAARFMWLAVAGIPSAILVAALTGRLEACIELMGQAWRSALPMHALTMLLSFVGSFCRTRAKAEYPLTICTAAYAAPQVLAPLAAAGANMVVAGAFPTVTGSVRLLLGALLVVSAIVWLASLRKSHANVKVNLSN